MASWPESEKSAITTFGAPDCMHCEKGWSLRVRLWRLWVLAGWFCGVVLWFWFTLFSSSWV